MPDRNKVNPIKGVPQIVFIKNQITRPNIIVGDYSYFDDDSFTKFEDHVTHHYEFIGDKLYVGKFCQIAKGIEFIMNGANHQMNSASTYPFFIFGFENSKYEKEVMPYKGDTVVGNDVWIGQNVSVMPGVKIGDGVIVAANSCVVSDLKPYHIYGGNPAVELKPRFKSEIIEALLELKWWDLDYEMIKENISILSSPNVEDIKNILN